MADSSKTSQITKRVRLTTTVKTGIVGESDVTFKNIYSVLAGLKHDIIVVLLTLLDELLELFIARLCAAELHMNLIINMVDVIHTIGTTTEDSETDTSTSVDMDAQPKEIFSTSSDLSPSKRTSANIAKLLQPMLTEKVEVS